MIRTWMLATVAAGLLVPSLASTQAPPRRPTTRPRVRIEGGPGVFTFSGSRGRIGVIVDTRADANGDKIGARIEGITPSGPAEKAGLKVGDVITSFRGTALGGAVAENDEDSGPGMKLIDLARALDPGDTVAIEYRRGTDTRKATLIAEDLGGDRTWTGSMEMPEMRGYMENMIPKMRMGGDEGGNFEVFMGSPWGGIELVKLNPDLGDYFGSREGVLVVKAPEDSSLALKGGDVIISIGGRKPSSPEQAMRILRSYDVGETVTLDVLRKQKHVNVAWKVPDHERSFFKMTPREEPSWFRVMPKSPALRIRNVLRTSRAI